MIVWDIETDSLDPSKIHCVVAKDRETGELHKASTTPDMVRVFQLIANNANVAHNRIEFDDYVIRKFFAWYRPHPDSMDSLILSRILFPKKGFQHGLGPWGERVGVSKPEIENWGDLPIEDYLHRCEEDVDINDLVYTKLLERIDELGGMEVWDKAIRLEHQVSKIHAEQHRGGVAFDIEKCYHNLRRLNKVVEGIDEKALPFLPFTYDVEDGRNKTSEREELGMYKYQKEPFYGTGKLKWWIVKHYDGSKHDVRGPFTRLSFRKIRSGSDVEVKKFLLEEGWVPEEWNYSKTRFKGGKAERTSPKLSQTDPFLGVRSIAGKILARRVQVVHRRSNCEGLLKRVREDGRISSSANPQGTPTARYAHRGLVNIPGGRSYFAREMRSMFIASPGFDILGIDVDSCQLYALANRIKDDRFTEVLTRGKKRLGTDQHTLNAGILSNAVEVPVQRDTAKTWIYA